MTLPYLETLSTECSCAVQVILVHVRRQATPGFFSDPAAQWKAEVLVLTRGQFPNKRLAHWLPRVTEQPHTITITAPHAHAHCYAHIRVHRTARAPTWTHRSKMTARIESHSGTRNGQIRSDVLLIASAHCHALAASKFS